MGLLDKDVFICVDCESTGLDTKKDRMIEVAAVRFTFSEILETYETLIDPERTIPEDSIAIHHITEEMVKGKPLAKDVIEDLLAFIGKDPIVGHGIQFDIDLIAETAEREGVSSRIRTNPSIDTLRLARLYGGSKVNSLSSLREHFNIHDEGAHRAMNDVVVNVEVFKQLTTSFKTTEAIHKRLEKPIEMRLMPLGKHKGRPVREMPLPYLRWAVRKDFDQDLIFTLKSELKRRNKGSGFTQLSNPFQEL
jgi:DNA polymerase-3 subunit epsilon